MTKPSVRWFVTVEIEGGTEKRYYRNVRINSFGSASAVDERHDLSILKNQNWQAHNSHPLAPDTIRESAAADLEYFLAELRAKNDGVLAIRPELVSVAFHPREAIIQSTLPTP